MKGVKYLVLTAIVAFGFGSPASAGTYDVYACGGPAGAAQNSFAPVAQSMMSAYSQCPSTGYVGTGIVTKATSNGGTAAHLSGAYQIFEAPPGAALDSVTFQVGALRFNRYWTVGLVAYDNDFNQGYQAYGCYANGPGCDLGVNVFQGPVTAPLYGRSKFRFETRCGNPGGCDVSYSGGIPGNRALFSMSNVAVRVSDYTLPSVVERNGSIWQAPWQRGRSEAWTEYTDNVGIMRSRLLVDGVVRDQQDYREQNWPAWVRCDFTLRRPCHDILLGGLSFDSTEVSDGEHTVQVEAMDAASNVSRRERRIVVDNTAPAQPVASVSGGEGWRQQNGFDVSLDLPGGQVSPIVRALYRICGPDGGCVEGERSGAALNEIADLRPSQPGDYTMRVWLQDAAGNVDAERASDPLHLRFDDRPPTGAFEGLDVDDPLAINAQLFDAHSGIKQAQIELRRRGESAWHEFPTSFAGTRATARIDDSSLANGVYEMRLRATDQAGNEVTIAKRGDGSPATLRLPLRDESRIALETERSLKVKRCPKAKPKRRGKKRKTKACKPKRSFETVSANGAARLRGTLSTPDGAPLANAAIHVSELPRARAGTLRSAAIVTDGVGRFSYRSDAGPSRMLTFRFGGGPLIRPVEQRLELKVRAQGTILPSAPRVRNGGSVRFSGKLAGGFLPERGKLIVLQAYYRGRWRAFATVRSDSRGQWSYRYRFGATYGKVVYRFRALVSFEASYPFEQAYSRVTKVTVRP